MLSRFLALVLVTLGAYQTYAVLDPVVHAAEPTVSELLRERLMGTIHAMGIKGDMVSHDDVSAIVAPLFPPGQTFAQTKEVVRQHNLGQLKMFKGTQTMPNGTMYVTRFGLVNGMISDVYVVIDFEFTGKNEKDMVLTATKAFLQSTSM